MSKKVIIRASISIGIVGGKSVDDYETEYSTSEWNALSEEEQEAIIEEYYQDHLANNLDGSAWVKTEEDEEL